jgi:hypothetical protein
MGSARARHCLPGTGLRPSKRLIGNFMTGSKPISDHAVARTTRCLFGLFWIVTLLAAQLDQRTRKAVLIDSWYRKSHPTFADALAAVRRDIWRGTGLYPPTEVLTSREGKRPHTPLTTKAEPWVRTSVGGYHSRPSTGTTPKPLRALQRRLAYALCHAA